MANPQKFCRSERILKPSEYQRVKIKGKRARAGTILVSILEGDLCGRRLGIVVSRHVGCAVVRNRIKRVVREFFRRNKESFPAGDCVVVVMSGAAKCDNDRIRSHLISAIEKMERKN